MKTYFTRLLVLCAVTVVLLAPSAFAQRQLGKKKGPTSKLYIAETKGDAQIHSGDKVYAVRQASAFDAPGTVIETGADSSTALVYSNGVGLVIGENSRIEITKFEQAPFSTSTAAAVDSNAEPSVSQSEVYLSRGTVGISTSEFLSGSSMVCATELGSIKIRGGNIAIDSRPDQSTFDLLEGAATVLNSVTGQSYLMQPGERIIIRRLPGGKTEIAVSPIPPAALPALNAFISTAANSKKTVTFQVIEQTAARGPEAASAASATGSGETGGTGDTAAGAAEAAGEGSFDSDDGTQEIVPKPTVPADLPTNIVISADRLPGG
jgi:hypothetical protein